MFRGLYVALVTPFDDRGGINETRLKELIGFHVREGTDGLVLCGTTGESACLTPEERERVMETAVQEAAGRLKIVAGAGARATDRTVQNVRRFMEIGADGALVVTPYYNRPGQEGLYLHFRQVAEAGEIPIILYNVPSRTGVDLLPDTVARLADHPNIVAIKEARPDIDRITELVARCGDKIDVLSGHDPNLYPCLSVGGRGIISVIGNIVPGEMKKLIGAHEEGDVEGARSLHLRLFPLCQVMAMDTNPIPIKGAMNLLGWDVGDVRPPLLPLTSEQLERMRDVVTEITTRE